MMDDALRQIDPGAFPPDPPGRTELWANPMWVIGPLVLELLAALAAWALLPRLVIVLSAALGVGLALVHYLKRKLLDCQARHLYELKTMSFGISRAPLAATPPPEPDFQQLNEHFPSAAAVHQSAWAHRNQPASDPALGTLTEEDKALWSKSRPALASVRSAEVLPRACYRCRRWIWLYRALARLPDWA